MTLSSEQIRHYREQGWVAPIDVMSPDEAAEILRLLEAAEKSHPEDLHPEHRNNAHLAFPFLANVVADQRIVDAACALVGPDVALWSTVLFVKEPDSAAHVSWHQDAFYMGLESDNFVTAWLALTPSTVESGCVSIVPGSHHTVAAHTDTFGADNILTRGQEVEDVDLSNVVHLELAPGQMSLHHPWLVHGSQPNRSDRRRIGLAMQSYLGARVRPQRGEHYVLPIRGELPHPSFKRSRPPIGDCTADARNHRAVANAALAAVLYDGAEQTRRL